MNRRAAILCALLLAGLTLRWQLLTVAPVGNVELETVPYTLDGWHGRPTPSLTARVVRILSADQYLSRTYANSTQVASLFVGYFGSQRVGATMHSPLNCLPGAGWQPIHVARLPFAGGGTVNKVLIEKGGERQVVVYWYQTAARLDASEYWSKFHMVVDAVTTRRNDAAMVRIAVPIDPTRPDGEADAAAAAMDLASRVEPYVASLFRQAPRGFES